MTVQWGKICSAHTSFPDKLTHVKKILRMLELDRKYLRNSPLFEWLLVQIPLRAEVPVKTRIQINSSTIIRTCIEPKENTGIKVRLQLSLEEDCSIDDFLKLSDSEKISKVLEVCEYHRALKRELFNIVQKTIDSVPEEVWRLIAVSTSKNRVLTPEDLLESIAGYSPLTITVTGTLSKEGVFLSYEDLVVTSRDVTIEIKDGKVTVHISPLDLLKLMEKHEEDYVVLPIRHKVMISTFIIGEYRREVIDFWRHNYKFDFWVFTSPLECSCSQSKKYYRTKHDIFKVDTVNGGSYDLPKLWGLFRIVKETEKSIWVEPVKYPINVARDWFYKTFPNFRLVLE